MVTHTACQCVYQFVEPRVTTGVDRSHVFGNHVCDGIHYFFMSVGAGWRCGAIVKCVLSWGLCCGGRSRGAFNFLVLSSFTTWSCITLCVDFKWLNKLVLFPWGATLSSTISLFRVRLLEIKVFQHHRIRFTFVPDQKLHFCHLLQSSSTRFSKTRTGNMHRRSWKRKFSGGGGAECTGGDGRVRCIYHTRHCVRQNDRYYVILFKGSQNQNWNSIYRPALVCYVQFAVTWSSKLGCERWHRICLQNKSFTLHPIGV